MAEPGLSMMQTPPSPGFDVPVPPNGYAWWYIDGISDDGREGITLIAMLGSVFSPYYARARRRGQTNPLGHSALNVALYRRAGKRWALTERGQQSVDRSATRLRIGPSELRWDGGALTVDLNEVTAPLPSRIRGQVRLYPQVLTDHTLELDRGGRHRWRPLAPRARVEVSLTQPRLSWSGTGYLDSNAGDEPLEDSFTSWDWSRGALDDGAVVLYDVRRRDGEAVSLALRFDAGGVVENLRTPPSAGLPRTTAWRMHRGTRSDPGQVAAVMRTLEDTPFYARSLVSSHLLGQRVVTMHESLCLKRFSAPWVQLLIPFRNPRSRF